MLHNSGWVVFSLCVFSRLQSSLLALFSCTLIISLVFAAIPLCHHIVSLFVTMAIAGSAMGVIDTIANLQLVNLYQKDSAIFLQVREEKERVRACVCAFVRVSVRVSFWLIDVLDQVKKVKAALINIFIGTICNDLYNPFFCVTISVLWISAHKWP